MGLLWLPRLQRLLRAQIPVTETLLAARADYRDRGFVPERVARSYEVSRAGQRGFRQRLVCVASACGQRRAPGRGMLVLAACAERRAGSAQRVTRLLGPTEPWLECCGLYPRQVGDREAADRAREKLAQAARGKQLVVADAGCALELQELRHSRWSS